MGDVLRCMEGSLAPVACLMEGALPCQRAAACRTLDFWRGLNEVIDRYNVLLKSRGLEPLKRLA